MSVFTSGKETSNDQLTRMHSSRMHTVHCSSRLQGGVSVQWECLTRGCLTGGVSAHGGGGCLARGVSA